MSTLNASVHRRVRHWATACAGAIALTAVVIIDTSSAQLTAGKLYVANDGTDNADCGPEGKSPCRSISRAIAHANAGDQIIVGPGLYGDLNRDRAINPSGDSGEEAPAAIPPVDLMSGTVSFAMIKIDKQLTIVSRDGAGATVIDAGSPWVNGSMIAVDVAASGVVFGKNRKGFTIRMAAAGLYASGVAGVTMTGNIVESCYYGFVVGSPMTGDLAEGTVLKGNVAVDNQMGGFTIVDNSAVVKGNLAKENFFGGFLVLAGPGTAVTKNVAVGNVGYGFLTALAATTTPTFSKNAAIGNTDAGVFVMATGTSPSVLTIATNTLVGNGVLPQYPPTNCGLVVQNSGAEMLTVNAGGNYWGAASGPGANPADAAGGSCMTGSVTLNLTQWASTEIKVKPPTIR